VVGRFYGPNLRVACPPPPSSYCIVYTHLLVSTHLPVVFSAAYLSCVVKLPLVSSRLASASSSALISFSAPAVHDPTMNDVESPTPSLSLLFVEHLSLVNCCVVSILLSWSSSLHRLVLIVASAAYRRSRLALSLASATACLDAAFAMRRHGRNHEKRGLDGGFQVIFGRTET
jgi:hypothetical protein